jgi:hypothetical protein
MLEPTPEQDVTDAYLESTQGLAQSLPKLFNLVGIPNAVHNTKKSTPFYLSLSKFFDRIQGAR